MEVTTQKVQTWLSNEVHAGRFAEKSDDEIVEIAFDEFDNDENEFSYVIRRAVEDGLEELERLKND